MNPQPPISVLCFEVIRDIFSNLDRKTLCLMQIIWKRFNLIIEKEFNGIPPYLILHKLMDGSWLDGSYEQIMWSVQIEDNSSVRKTLPTLNKLAKCKFIRFKETYFFFYHNNNFTPMDILPISHVWENGFLKVNWEDLKEFRPADEFYRALTKCSELYLEGTNAIQILHEVNFCNYRELRIEDNAYDDPLSHDIPWEKIKDYLFRAVERGDMENIIVITTKHSPNHQEFVEFVDSVKQEFAAANIELAFGFYWSACIQGHTNGFWHEYFNDRTKQRLIFTGRGNYRLYTKRLKKSS